MNNKTLNRLLEFVNSVKSGQLSVNANGYSPTIEPQVQQAVALKRNGQYDDAVNIYLDLLKDMRCANSELTAYLYKVVICAEQFYLGYQLLTVMETAISKTLGPKCPLRLFPGGPVMGYINWWTTDYKQELYSACIQAQRNRSTWELLEYVRPKSGNPSYKFSNSDSEILRQVSQILSEIS